MKSQVTPKWVENITGELVQENPQEAKMTELQVPRIVQVPGTADRPALISNFQMTGVLQQRHLVVQQPYHKIEHSITGHPSEGTCRLPFSSYTS